MKHRNVFGRLSITTDTPFELQCCARVRSAETAGLWLDPTCAAVSGTVPGRGATAACPVCSKSFFAYCREVRR
jgi:hypothetical protein